MDKETLIKTIEHCISTENECYNCALGGETMLKPCRVKLLENALVIIKEQENEIESLRAKTKLIITRKPKI